MGANSSIVSLSKDELPTLNARIIISTIVSSDGIVCIAHGILRHFYVLVGVKRRRSRWVIVLNVYSWFM